MKVNLVFILFALAAITACSVKVKDNSKAKSMKAFVIRLKPGEDLKASIEKFVREKNIEAGWIVTCAGSLTGYNIRFANQPNGSSGSGHFEIVSLAGTLSVNGSHIHLSIADSTGKTIGGHLMQGCKIYTTAEIVIEQSNEMIFRRHNDGTTPWDELQIQNKNEAKD